MRVLVVCTGNVARSPALHCLLATQRPDLQVTSAGVGSRARAGRRMARPMRDILTRLGFGEFATAHRSTPIWEAEPADLIVTVAPVHARRLDALGIRTPHLAVGPIADPAFGGVEAYREVWPEIIRAADWLAREL